VINHEVHAQYVFVRDGLPPFRTPSGITKRVAQAAGRARNLGEAGKAGVVASNAIKVAPARSTFSRNEAVPSALVSA